jgi:predicted SAM-dependent methyltransferase
MWRFLKRLPVLRDPARRRALRQLPIVSGLTRAVRKTRRAYYRHLGRAWLRRTVAASPHRKIVIGAWSRYDAGWIPTQREFLDLLEPDHWERCFQPDSVEAMLAEHVWEHMTEDEGLTAARTCFHYLKPGGYLRIAVPDGLLPDPAYVDLVKPDPDARSRGHGPDGNSANHKALYTYRSLQALFEKAGFRVVLYEYFDEAGTFHCRNRDDALGTIWRSSRFDPRNTAGKPRGVYPGSLEDYLAYVSIILDAVKPRAPVPQQGQLRVESLDAVVAG